MIRKRKKSVKARGYTSHFRGKGGKRARGHGNKGGVGRAGHGKRAAHKKIMFLKAEKQKQKKKKTAVINIADLPDVAEVKLGDVKLLARGKAKPITVYVKHASKAAVEKIEKAGGKVIIEQ